MWHKSLFLGVTSSKARASRDLFFSFFFEGGGGGGGGGSLSFHQLWSTVMSTCLFTEVKQQ